MAEKETTFSTTFIVRSYEVDEKEEVTLSNICNYFQEAAGLNAHHLNFDISDLSKKGLTWILYHLHIKIIRFPKRWEKVIVKTWPSAGQGVRAYRDYELFDSRENLLASGLSHWMMLDIKKMRPVRIPDEILNLGETNTDHVLAVDHESLKALDDNNPQLITRVGKQDLDMNNHVNNVKYIDWVTGHLEADVTRKKKCNELKIQYVSAANIGDEIFLTQRVNGNQNIRHTLFGGNSKKVLANAQTSWR